MTSKIGSVIYVIDSDLDSKANADLRPVQQVALKSHLPMSLVYCLEEWNPTILARLKPVETALADHNIPLIVLVGSAEKTLAGFIHHTKPVQVFRGGLPLADSLHINAHHVRWPGVVIAIDQLIDLYAAGKISC